jgi:hypothetical protein
MLFDRISEARYAQNLPCSSPRAGVWFIAQPVFFTFRLSFLAFPTTLHMQGLPHISIARIPWCVCTHPINPTGIHFLRCVHNNEHIRTHDGICDTFVTIARNVGFHVRWEQLHALSSTTFNSSCRWVYIVFTKYGIHTLANVIIVNPTWADLLPRSCTTQGFVTLDAIQAKEKSYHNRHPTNQFFPLAIEVFGCLHKHADVFLHYCANAIWSLKVLEGPHFFTLIIFLCQKNSITLQKMQASSILSRVVVIGLTTPNFHPFRTHLLSPQLIYYKPLVFDINIWLTNHRGLVLDSRDFDIYVEPAWCPIICWMSLTSNNFSLFNFFTPLYIF